MSNNQILKEFELFSLGTGGIGDWLTEKTDVKVFERIASIEKEPLTQIQLNQILILGHQAPVSDGFFQYYWENTPLEHPYDVSSFPGFQKIWIDSSVIKSIEHLKWGLSRLFIDGLLWFGNVRAAYRFLRDKTFDDLSRFFKEKRFNTETMRERGLSLPLNPIAKDDRYLISEMACKSYGDTPSTPGELKEALILAFRNFQNDGGATIKIRKLLDGEIFLDKYKGRQQEFVFSADDVLEESVTTEEELEQKYEQVAKRFFKARESALVNTQYYLSAVGNLDVYVATSMRKREDFRIMADFCEKVFSDERLNKLNLQYFDPTLSAATGHEDKGLIECLMVKCTKALVYCAGESESYGKDAEAAMALCLGKPVIFYCDHDQRTRFYREVHPLSRMVEFDTGVAVGAMVTDSVDEVSELLYRIFENRMEYRIEKPKPGYLRLIDQLTNSVVRLQTNDQLLTETFWNHYYISKNDSLRNNK